MNDPQSASRAIGALVDHPSGATQFGLIPGAPLSGDRTVSVSAASRPRAAAAGWTARATAPSLRAAPGSS